MKLIFKPIALNAKVFNVAILHKALAALDIPVIASEVSSGKAGKDTLKKVRALQARLGIEADESTLVDEETGLAIAAAMARLDLTSASRSFNVSGSVKLNMGQIKSRQRLIAFDLDLRAVAKFRDIKDLKEANAKSGFEFLGEVVSDNNGRYDITFFEWQYRRAERGKADVVVYALEKDKIVGFSRLVNTDDYSDKGFVRDLDIIISHKEERSEYDVLMDSLNKFLKESESTLAEIAVSKDQLAFCAGELLLNRSHLDHVAFAELIVIDEESLNHELLYAIARQDISLEWDVLYKKKEDELHAAISKSAKDNITAQFSDREIKSFIGKIQRLAIKHILEDVDGTDSVNPLNEMLSHALTKNSERTAFLKVLGEFEGDDFNVFWDKNLAEQKEFKDNPGLISGLKLTQQLTALSNNHQPLVKHLQVGMGIKSANELINLNNAEWLEVIKKSGLPDSIAGEDATIDIENKRQHYADSLQNRLNATFPTQRIAKMAKDRDLGIESSLVAKSVDRFLSKNERFDFTSSRLHDFKEAIERESRETDAKLVSAELMKLQRVFQVSTDPQVMTQLLKSNLHSAHAIAGMPRVNFVKTYGKSIGGEDVADAVHQRAEFISRRTEFIAMDAKQFGQGSATPALLMLKKSKNDTDVLLKEKFPNYKNLFGSPDLCECQHCRSVYSPAAYFVDLLRFLQRSEFSVGEESENIKRSPYDYLVGKKDPNPDLAVQGHRPDLAKLALSCENINTLIPYIDLSNEVMESYVVNDSLDSFTGHNTGKATADELRANPQQYNIAAYRKVSAAKFPFSLPFHQPLDEIRTYSDYLNFSRYEVMQAVNPTPSSDTIRVAIETEALNLSAEAYSIMVDDSSETNKLREYYGYENDPQTDLEVLSQVREFMNRSGIQFTDLVEIVKTKFINPHQPLLEFLDGIFSASLADPSLLYPWLEKVAVDQITDLESPVIPALAAHSQISTEEFVTWAKENFEDLKQVLTLHEPDSRCNLDTTVLRTLGSINNANGGPSGIIDNLPKLHRFIRLWRKTGWSIHATDLILNALGESDIGPETITKLESVLLIKKASKLGLDQLAVLWGDIDTYGQKSLYHKLFLNKAAQQIDTVFEADAQGNYLSVSNLKLIDHKSSILAAFRMSEEELNRVVALAEIDLASAQLNINNLSTIYRHVVLSKALKLKVTDLCKLIELFEHTPFASPEQSFEFYALAAATKSARFKPSVLDYIFNDVLTDDSGLGLSKEKILLTAKAIRDGFTVIEQSHPLAPESGLTSELVAEKLAVTFQAEVVSRLIAIIDGPAVFEKQVVTNLVVDIPADLENKVSYIPGSGLLTSIGVMSAADRDVLKELNSDVDYKLALDELFQEPEVFLKGGFLEIFEDINDPGNLIEANKILLNRPAQATAAELADKLTFIYERYLPSLRRKLQQDTISAHIADLIGLDEQATALLLARKIETLADSLSLQGFSADYFNTVDWDHSNSDAVVALDRVDNTIDFAWGAGSPDADNVTGDTFSVRWRSYIAAPASGEFTLLVDIEENDETFNLYLDGSLILNKDKANTATSFEIVTNLNAAQSHLLVLEYSEDVGKAGVRLRWKTSTSAPEIIPADVAYPAKPMEEFVVRANMLHRAAKFVTGFSLSETEIDSFTSLSNSFSGISFEDITPIQWQRVFEYSQLRKSVPQNNAFLTDVFALANQTDPVPVQNELSDIIVQATVWDRLNLNYLIDEHFKLDIEDFRNEIALIQILDVMKIVAKTGLSAEAIVSWGTDEKEFDKLHENAQLLKNAVRAKYDDNQWLELAAGLSDKIRENQKQALICYLLVQKTIRDAGVIDADSLYEHFLIDVQMGACMDTSRIVQANAAIQLFVNRILLNLEKDISPDIIDKNRWEWMKNYRVWEANRKVFLYPENWLEPEWRNDRSELFKELESHLLQNDITERSAEQGLRNYLMSLSEVANLDVCGMHQEVNGKENILHVFGRTHNLPYKYFYRRWNESHKWSAWEKVQIDIRGVEDGVNSGVHLLPVVWKGRLYLFWPEFIEAVEPQRSTDSFEVMGEKSADGQSPNKYWEIRLAWSEYIDDTWSSKQVSKDYLTTSPISSGPPTLPSSIRIHPRFEVEENSLVFIVTFSGIHGQYFELLDIHSPIRAYNCKHHSKVPTELGYENTFSKIKVKNYGRAPLQTRFSSVYLRGIKKHELLKINSELDLEFLTNYPFFYSDGDRTYFANPTGNGLLVRDPNADILSTLSKVDSSFRGLRNSVGKTLILKDDWHGEPDIPPIDGTIIIIDVFPVGSGAGLVRGNLVSDPGECFTKYNVPIRQSFPGVERSLVFNTFYHPYASEYVRRLNQIGISSLMASNIEIIANDEIVQTAEETLFGINYKPKFTNGPLDNSIVRHTALAGGAKPRTLYLENVCFDGYGANSLYNWELFFHAPLYIATRLSKNGKYEEAMKWFHYIFDPTSSETASEDDTARFWKVKPFKAESKTVESLEAWFRELAPNSDAENPGNDQINEWRKYPFDPHLVASNRPIAYMKQVVIKYVENLIAWGDSLFRQFTRESVYEAIQVYVIASHVLGPRPEFVPKRGEINAETYASLKDKLDDFANALVELENIFPYSSSVKDSQEDTGASLLGIGSALYFCIPDNDKLIGYWDTVADRLFKIRHCHDLDGVERSLALFAPPIDPAALIQANSQGLSLGSILSDLGSPPPIYRYGHLVQKANEICNDVKALGSALLSTIEKKDGEELSRLRASQETNMLERVTGIRERQVLAAKASKENLHKVRETAKLRLQHYKDLLGDDSSEPIDAPILNSQLKANSQLPTDTGIPLLETEVDMSLVESDETGVKIISRENEQLSKNDEVKLINATLSGIETLAGLAYAFPNIGVYTAPLGVGASAETGASYIAAAIHMGASAARGYSSYLSAEASQASTLASYARRTHDWTLQANLTIREIIQLDKQITSADIQIQVAEKELQNHEQQIRNSKQVELFIKDKFSNQELYQWMKEQTFSVYKQSYNLAFEMAKKAEKAFQYELGTESTSLIQYGYWENSTQGLVSGEKLGLALRQLESAYLDQNKRLLELRKTVSLAWVNPLALIKLRETGSCRVNLPEELFDLDFQGHYCRRIKSVSLTIPCISGPNTAVNCTLRLLNNSTRINPSIPDQYPHNSDEGVLIDDDRFRQHLVPVTSIATSSAQNDSGLFEFNFRDERYLPFEGSGAISEWELELSDPELQQFDYATISDVILHINYTAKETSGTFKEKVVAYIKEFVRNSSEKLEQPLVQLFSMKQEFPSEWHKFLHPSKEGTDQVLSLVIGKQRFPFFTQDQKIEVLTMDVFAQTNQDGPYNLIFNPKKLNVSPEEPEVPAEVVFPMKKTKQFGDLHFVKDLDSEQFKLEIDKELKLTLKRGELPLEANPPELEDLLFVLHYSFD